MEKSLKFKVYWQTLGYLLVCAVVYLSLGPPPDISPDDIPGLDKFFHFLAYSFLMLWFAQLHSRTVFWLIAALFFAMGAGMEVAQFLTDDRTFEVGDMVANGVGVGFGWASACLGGNSILDSFEKRFLNPSFPS